MNNKNLEIIASEEVGNTKVEVLSYKVLKGSSDPKTAETLFFASQTGLNLKMVRITINNSSLRVEPGALYYMKGDLEIKASTGGGILKGLARKVTSGESFFVNEIHGTGEIYLEPTFGHFLLHNIEEGDDGIICDKKMFYAGTNNLDIGASLQKNVSSALFGGEGLWQTSINGVGIAILYSPVPAEEVAEYKIDGDKLSVDGNFALMRTTGVEFKAEKSSKTWIATSISGEGLLQTFSGNGRVWIAPTQGVYNNMSKPNDLSNLLGEPKSMGTKT